MCCLASTESAFEPGSIWVFGCCVFVQFDSSKWSNSRATLAVSNLSESCSTSEAEEVGSLKSIFAIGTPLSCTRFFFSAASSSARSIACCRLFLALKALSAAFSWSFFYIFLLSKGDSWNPIDMELIPIWRWLSEDEVFATNSFTL